VAHGHCLYGRRRHGKFLYRGPAPRTAVKPTLRRGRAEARSPGSARFHAVPVVRAESAVLSDLELYTDRGWGTVTLDRLSNAGFKDQVGNCCNGRSRFDHDFSRDPGHRPRWAQPGFRGERSGAAATSHIRNAARRLHDPGWFEARHGRGCDCVDES